MWARASGDGSMPCHRHTTIGVSQISHSAIQHTSSSWNQCVILAASQRSQSSDFSPWGIGASSRRYRRCRWTRSAPAPGTWPCPTAPKGPGILVLHAWWGLTTTSVACATGSPRPGYVALAPDLFAGRVATEVADAEQQLAAADANELAHLTRSSLHDPARRCPSTQRRRGRAARLVDGRLDGAVAGGPGARRRRRHRRLLRRPGHRHGRRPLRVPRPLRRARPLRRRGRPGPPRVRAAPRRARRRRSTATPAPATGSPSPTAPSTTRPPPPWPGTARSRSSASTSRRTDHAPVLCVAQHRDPVLSARRSSSRQVWSRAARKAATMAPRSSGEAPSRSWRMSAEATTTPSASSAAATGLLGRGDAEAHDHRQVGGRLEPLGQHGGRVGQRRPLAGDAEQVHAVDEALRARAQPRQPLVGRERRGEQDGLEAGVGATAPTPPAPPAGRRGGSRRPRRPRRPRPRSAAYPAWNTRL